MFRLVSRLARTGLVMMTSLVLPVLVSAQTVYVTGGGNGNSGFEFGTINLATGAYTNIATERVNLSGLSFSSTGTLYAMDIDGTKLYTVNTSTGALTSVGSTGSTNGTSGIAFSPSGVLYQVNNLIPVANSYLNRVNTSNANLTRIGTDIGHRTSGSIAYQNGVLYETNTSTGSDTLDTINTTLGTSTAIGSTGYSVIAGLTSVNGTLYGFDAGGDILTLNTTTGAGTVVKSYTLPAVAGAGLNTNNFIEAAAFQNAAVPEPTTLALLASLGLTGIGAIVRRKRRSA